MSCELFIAIQTIVLVTIVSWAKAGLTGWSDLFIAGLVIVGLVVAPLLRRRETGRSMEIPWKASAPILMFAGIGLFGLFNPFFINLAESSAFVEKEEQEVFAKKAFSLGEDPAYIERVQREMRFFRSSVIKGNYDDAMARFELAARYVSNHQNTVFKPIFNRYSENMEAGSPSWLPGVVTRETAWAKLYVLVLVLLQGVWVHAYIQSQRCIRWLLCVLASNCVLLAIAGIVQKLAYDPSNLPIWGIWDAPVRDKNYYFASFTYKNHWCAYATLGFGILAGLTMHWLRRHPADLLRGSPVPLALLGMGILALSVPISASLLGILLMLGVGIPFIGFLCLRMLPGGLGRWRWLVALSITLLLPLAGIWMVLTSNPDIKNEAIHKIIVRWQALKDGRMPWRYHHSKDSLAMFYDKPVFGWGLGSTFPLYPRYVSGEIIEQSEDALAFAHHDERFFFAEHSHNDWFQYLAETGVMGVCLLGLAPLYALRHFRLSSSLATCTVLVCGALAVFSLVDFPSRTPACLILFAVTYGCSIKYMANKGRLLI